MFHHFQSEGNKTQGRVNICPTYSWSSKEPHRSGGCELEISQGLQLCHSLTGVIATENVFGIISLLPPLLKILELFFPFIHGDVFHIKSTCTSSSKNTLLEGFLYLPHIHELFSGQISGSDIDLWNHVFYYVVYKSCWEMGT